MQGLEVGSTEPNWEFYFRNPYSMSTGSPEKALRGGVLSAIVNNSQGVSVSAEAILKSWTGRSLSGQGVEVTAENVTDFAPSTDVVLRAKAYFQKKGFRVGEVGTTMTISGSPPLFEDVFQVKLTVRATEMTEGSPGGVLARPQSEPVVPEQIKDIVEAVIFPEPPELF